MTPGTNLSATSEHRRAPHPDIAQIKITEDEIATRVRALGAEIGRDYENKDLILVGILKGATLFLADLVRTSRFRLPLTLSLPGPMARTRAPPAWCGF
jgi:hypothetical protein